MAPPLLQLTGIGLSFGGPALITGADLSIAAGERIALVGRNGSGKSTLLKIAAGLVTADRGTLFRHPSALIHYLPQEPDFAGQTRALDYVQQGLGPSGDPHGAARLLEDLGLDPQAPPEGLSGGEARRLALARVLAADPDILLLDEPTNHLDLPTIEWLENDLARRKAGIVLISHDRRFLNRLTRTTIWLDRGETRRLEFGFEKFEAWRDEFLAEEELNAHKLERRIAREEHWLRYGVSARRKRNVRRLDQLKNLRQDHRAAKPAPRAAIIGAEEAEKSGALVIEAVKASFAYDRQPIVRDLTLRIKRGDRLGVIGANGAGKTTLLKMLTGALMPQSGSVRLGSGLEIAQLDQRRDSLSGEMSLRDALTGGHGDQLQVGGEVRHVISYMKDFLFTAEQAGTPLRVLSGGERARVMLARGLARPSNLLVLDEPTNDLDLETLDVLEETLTDYRGTILLVSHDRDFLDRIATQVLVPEGDGTWQIYAGGYADMIAQRGAELNSSLSRKPAKAPGTISDPTPATRAPARARLSYKDKRALETLPTEIAALEREIAKLTQVLADPALYARDRKAFDRASQALQETQAKLSTAEDRWLELDLLRGELEGD